MVDFNGDRFLLLQINVRMLPKSFLNVHTAQGINVRANEAMKKAAAAATSH